MDVRVELLVAPGCASREEVERLVRGLLAELAPAASFETTVVDSAEAAQRLEFPGSPTVRVNGRDLEPEVGLSRNFGLG